MNFENINKEWKSQANLGQWSIFLCAVLWSTSGLFIKIIDWHPAVIAGIRSIIAFIFLLGIRFLTPSRRIVPFKLNYALLGGIAYCATVLTFVHANKLTTAANAILIQYGSPIWAALLGWALAKEKPRFINWISLILLVGGLGLFFKDGLGGGSFAGNMLALLSGICFAASSVFLRIQKQGNVNDTILFAHLLVVVYSIPFLFTHRPVFSVEDVSVILYMGIIQIGLTSLLFAYGIRRITAVKAMLTTAIEPILNPIWVLLFLGEKPPFTALLGGLVIIIAVIISSVRER